MFIAPRDRIAGCTGAEIILRTYPSGFRNSCPSWQPALDLLVLGSSIGLRAEVGRGGSSLEEAAENGLQERVEDNLGAAVMVVRP